MLLKGYRKEIFRPECNSSFQSRDLESPGSRRGYKLLPKTNCRKCGQPTCMMFASLAAQGATGAGDCPDMKEEEGRRLKEYLGRFRFD